MKTLVYPFQDIEQLELPAPEDTRYGNYYVYTMRELQVGDSYGKEANPKIMRVDKQGMWLGQRRFLNPLKNPNDPFKFQVDMLGNVTAVSFRTAFFGQRVVIQNNQIEFYDPAGNLQGEIFGDNLPSLVINGINEIKMQVSGVPFMTLDNTFNVIAALKNMIPVPTDVLSMGTAGNRWLQMHTDFLFLYNQLLLAQLAADPVVSQNGAMYYNTTIDEVRVFKAGSWRSVITT